VIAHWADIEADFTREYPGIDFPREVWSMPWRRFMVLLRGLSSTSWWQIICRANTKSVAGDETSISDPAEVDRLLAIC